MTTLCTKEHILLKILDQIEERECKLLTWGIVDGFFQLDELEDLIDPIIDLAIESDFEGILRIEEIISELLESKLIVKVEASQDSIGYRSRMAETVRLFQRLRQLFPKHSRNSNGWQQAANLVADYRFCRRPRQFAKPAISRSSAISRIQKITTNQTLIRAIAGLLGGDDNFNLFGFQVRAAERILRSIELNEPTATIVCAGTGSGKTFAFYLPAIATVLRNKIENDQTPWVKVVAIYPRTELLKDQVKEVINQVLTLDDSFDKFLPVVGVMYGDTPSNSNGCKWKKSGNNYICPYLRCPKCQGDMHWMEDDKESGVERLICSDCAWEIPGSAFPLTRKSITKLPPDILFTTTEMLNQRLSDNQMNHIFGVGKNAFQPPDLVLLDEVHTYEARHGAQVAYLMRRWSHLVGSRLRFVGLSATLRDAAQFFASLTGTPESKVGEVSPSSREIVYRGAEYMIALRGDPVSRAALLSTSIQTCMLIGRCLDPLVSNPMDSVSKGIFGQKTFVFTDDLDVTNRLYFDLLSAEGRTSWGAPDMQRSPNGGLAVLRQSGPSLSRYRGGQDWRMSEEVGHTLSERLNVSRVSSQDRGIDSGASVIVATAALEVGFDDPAVGAVLQHKAPRSVASFLQRKGRAGRSPIMRPWTVIVLSDYGRDRIAYQGYDILFDPEIPPRTLPLSNRYITKMQAVYALIDYLGRKISSGNKISVWKALSRPGVKAQRLIDELQSIIDYKNSTRQLEYFLKRSLRLSEDQVSSLMWEYPRPLMTTVIPTALRRLRSGWKLDGEPGADFQIQNNPLPEFIPATLFADLNMAEVGIFLPETPNNRYIKNDSLMSFFSALREFAPGRVSRRFAVHDRFERFWIAASLEDMFNSDSANLEIDDFFDWVPEGNFQYFNDGLETSLSVVRPRVIKPSLPDTNVTDSSSGYLNWHSQLLPRAEPIWLEPPKESVWKSLVPRIGFFTHSRQSPIEVRRFSRSSTAEVSLRNGDSNRLDINFKHDDEDVAVGIGFAVDGIVFELEIPSNLSTVNGEDSEKWRALRSTRYFDAAAQSGGIQEIANPFLREWLAQVYLSALTYESISQGIDPEAASGNLLAGTAEIKLEEVLEILFQSRPIDAPDDDNEVENNLDRLHTEIQNELNKPEIVQALYDLSKFLWVPISDEWDSWLANVYKGTFGSAILKTIGDLCTNIDLGDLIVDLGRGCEETSSPSPSNEGIEEIWISERSPGGSGMVEEFMLRYSEDPRRFFSMVRASLGMGEFELIDDQISRLFHLLVDDSLDLDLRHVISQIRAQNSYEQLSGLAVQLRSELLKNRFSPFHGFIASIGNRVLRPGASQASDFFIANAISKWTEEESRLGIEIDLRIICYYLSLAKDIETLSDDVGVISGQDTPAWRMSIVYGLLWPRGSAVRNVGFRAYNPYSTLPPVERLLVESVIVNDRARISVDESESWVEPTYQLLSEGKLVALVCDDDNREYLGIALDYLITNPVETGYLRAFARLQGIRQGVGQVEADIELLEAIQ